MARTVRRQRLLSLLAFGLLALVTELAGRSLTLRFDVGRHVASPGDTTADYYPVLLIGVKAAIALLLARLAWRVVKARAAERAARRVLGALPAERLPRVRLRLSPRLWLAFFAATSLFYLVQTDAEQLSAGRWPLLAPWLHTSALPVFAVLAVVAAVAWSAVAGWLADYERYVEAVAAQARRAVGRGLRAPRPAECSLRPPRLLFGLAFESRPPPVAA